MWEPGFWNLTDREAESFRSYLLKGGFAVFEDFDRTQQWNNFEAQMRRVIPDGRFVRIENAHQIFDAFFQVKDQGLFPFDASNEAYKLGVNYVVYGLTH